MVGTMVYYTYARRIGDHWVGSTEPKGVSIAEFWNRIDAISSTKRPVYIVANRATDFAVNSSLCSLCDEGRYHNHIRAGSLDGVHRDSKERAKGWVGYMVLSDPPAILSLRGAAASLRLVSVGNFVDMPLRKLAEAIGYDAERIGASESNDAHGMVDPYDECKVITLVMRQMISKWVSGGNGTWRDTIAQQSMSIWRSRYYGARVCRHDNRDAGATESAALHGGRASVWYFGDVGWRMSIGGQHEPSPPLSPYGCRETSSFRVDVSAMHGYLLYAHRYPTRFMSACRDIQPRELASILRYYGAVATVEVESHSGEYPVRHGASTIYPAGRFITTLAGPELIDALEHDCIRRVIACNRYEMGEPFKGLADYLLYQRMACKGAGDLIGELQAKQLINAFAGKLAQGKGKWVVRPKLTAPQRWGEWRDVVYGQDELKRYRAIAGLTQEYVTDDGSPRMLAAAYAYVTAYCRLHMRRLRRHIGCDNVYSQDTDGLWISDDGLDRARTLPEYGGSIAGSLLNKGQSIFSRWLSARHYYACGRWTLAGYALDHDITSDLCIVEYGTSNSLQRPSKRCPAYTLHTRRVRPFLSIRPDVPVCKDTGWAKPFYIPNPAYQAEGKLVSDWDQHYSG